MTANPAVNRQIDLLMKQILKTQQKVAQLERNQRAAQLGNASIENGALLINDADGNTQIQLGLQQDGSFAHVAITGTDPGLPSDPDVAAGISSLLVTWDGLMADGSLPLADFEGVQVHVSSVPLFTPDVTTLKGVLTHQGTYTATGLEADQIYYVLLVAMNQAGESGAPSNYVTGIPQLVVEGIAPGSISSLLLTAASSKNILVDPQFTVPAWNRLRLSDPKTVGQWVIDQALGVAENTTTAGESMLSLMPSNGVPLFINPGEVYFLSITATVVSGSGVTVGIEIAGTDGLTNEAINFSALDDTMAPTEISGQVTIPVGQAGGYIRVFTIGGSGAVVQLSSPVAYLTQGSNELQTGSVTAVALAADSVTAFAMAADSVTAGTISVGALDGLIINAPVINGGMISGTDFIASGQDGGVFAYSTGGTQVVTFKSSASWLCPLGVTTVFAETTGAASSGDGTTGADGGDGGGGGEWAADNVGVTQLNVYPVVVGTGGAASSGGGSGSAGGSSTFTGDSLTVRAHGGQANGQGGTGSVNAFHNDGGDGGSGGLGTGIGHSGVVGGGGGGGGSAGSSSSRGNDGENGGQFEGGAGGTSVGGGRGGQGGERNTNGGSGTAPGGASGGAGGTDGSFTRNSDDGSAGQVRLTYTSASPQLVAALAGASIADPVAGVTLSPGLNLIGGTSVAVLTASTTGYAQMTNKSGYTQRISGSGLSVVNKPSVTTSGNFSLGFITVPAHDVETGAVYHGHAQGNFSTGTSVPSSAAFTVYWGGVSGTSLSTLTIPGTLGASISSAGWFADFEVTWLSVTEAACRLTIGWHTGAGVSNSVLWFFTNDITGLDTTVDQSLSLGFSWGSAPAGTVLSTLACRIGRLA